MYLMHFYMVALLKKMYMEQLNGFVDPSFPDHVCRKALYGLK